MARATVDMRDLIAKMKDVQKLVDKTTLEVTQKLTLECGRRLIEASPVDSGLFRGSWVIETPSRAYQAGTITNNTVYGSKLAKGHSPQAESGWVDNAIQATIRFGAS